MEQSLYCHSFSTCHILYDTDLAYPNMNLNGAFDFVYLMQVNQVIFYGETEIGIEILFRYIVFIHCT